MNMEMNTVNIHEYPADSKDLDDYRIAVMQAHKAGHVLESRPAYTYDCEWMRTAGPSWNWKHYQYRIAAPKIAKGHNPDQLTEDQVGVKDGWRLIEQNEQGRKVNKADVQYWSNLSSRWRTPLEDVSPLYAPIIYRTKKPEGYFLPKAEVPLAELDSSSFDAALVRYEITADSTLSGAFSCGWNAALQYERSRAK